MVESFNEKSINESMRIIKEALQEDNDISENNINDVLVLNQLVKEDGTIETINENSINKSEVKKILDTKITEVVEKQFDKWLDKNLPNYIEKHLSKKDK